MKNYAPVFINGSTRHFSHNRPFTSCLALTFGGDGDTLILVFRKLQKSLAKKVNFMKPTKPTRAKFFLLALILCISVIFVFPGFVNTASAQNNPPDLMEDLMDEIMGEIRDEINQEIRPR